MNAKTSYKFNFQIRTVRVVTVLIILAVAVFEMAQKSELESNKVMDCKQRAISVWKEGMIAVCSRADHKYLEFTEVFVYDSTDEIQRNASTRSDAWKAAANALGKQAPFGVLGFIATKISEYYYRVVFDYHKQPDF